MVTFQSPDQSINLCHPKVKGLRWTQNIITRNLTVKNISWGLTDKTCIRFYSFFSFFFLPQITDIKQRIYIKSGCLMTEETHSYHPLCMTAVCLKLRLVTNLTDHFQTGEAKLLLFVTWLLIFSFQIFFFFAPQWLELISWCHLLARLRMTFSWLKMELHMTKMWFYLV